jgi:NAD(P)H-flavin reductase/hemoglobin-like flavoprotein
MTADPHLDLLMGLSVQGEEPASRQAHIAKQVRHSWELVEPRIDELTRLFYGLLFHRMPAARDLFPVNMAVQRSRLLRALVHVVRLVDQPAELDPFLEQLGRDHRKFAVVDEHYEALGHALVGALREFSGTHWSREAEDAWTEAYAIISARMRAGAATDQGPASWTGHVVEHRRIGQDIAVVTLQTEEPILYRAGQYMSVETPRRPRLWRYLSPATPPRSDGTIEFHVRAVPEGWVSRAIVSHTTVGETWRIGRPMGRMAVDGSTDDGLLMVAGGTGMAPLRALLMQLIDDAVERHTTLFVGGRTRDDLYDLPFLQSLADTHAWLDLAPVVSGPDANGTRSIHGNIAHVAAGYGAWEQHDVLICGSPHMTRATVSQLIMAGTPLNRIHYDPFTLD